MRFAFVHICLAPRPWESLRAIAHKRTRCIHANSIVFTRWPLFAFIDILGAVNSLVSGRTWARKWAIDWTCVANCVRMARIWRASVVQVTQEASLTGRTAAVEATDTVYAGGAIKTGRINAIVNVIRTIGSGPTIYADARVAAVRICACGAILANWWPVNLKKHR